MKTRIKLKSCIVSGFIVLSSQVAMAENSEVTPTQVIDTFEHAFGVTPSERRNHTKGTCAVGKFEF